MRRYGFLAAHGTLGRPGWRRAGLGVGVLCLLTAACSDDSSVDMRVLQAASGRTINTRVFDCADSVGVGPFEFTIRLGPGELALWLPMDFGIPYVVLSQDFELPDATYREGELELRLQPDIAELSVGDRRYGGCRLNAVRSVWEHAKLSGVDFRATGSDPSWYLEIRNGGPLVFSVENGSVGIEAPTPVADTDESAGTTTYITVVRGQRLMVRISLSICSPQDGTSMAGSTVIVNWEDRDYVGCGRALH